MLVGKLKEIWRYPVKSLGGDTVESAHVHEYGIAGDRGWALIDTETDDICSAKQLSDLLNLVARYRYEPPEKVAYRDDIPPVIIQFPDGRELVNPKQQADAISDLTGRPLALRPLEPPENIDHYRRSIPLTREFMMALKAKFKEDIFGPQDDERKVTSILMECTCPPGTYQDAFPLHLLTTAALQHMTEETGELFDHRRFRPNLLVETENGIDGFAEFSWVGKSLRVGEVLLKVESRTLRCSMPTQEQAHFGLSRNRRIGRSLNEITNHFLGANISVQHGGSIRTGDWIELLE
jgi:uncharacterized protein YcbX